MAKLDDITIMVIEHLASKDLYPPEGMVDDAVHWALRNFFSTSPPYNRFSGDGSNALDDFFRVSVCHDKSRKVIVVVQYGSNKVSKQHLYGGEQKGVTDRLCISSWLSARYGNNAPPPPDIDTSAVDVCKQKALAEIAARETLEKYASKLRLVESIDDHPYLQHKRIDIQSLAKAGLRLGLLVTKDGVELALPAYNRAGAIQAYTRIFRYVDESGKYKRGIVGKISGCYTPVGFASCGNTSIAFCEGYASALAANLLLKVPAVCVHGAGNAAKALATVKHRYPELEEPIDCFDDDEAGEVASKAFATCWGTL